MYGPHVANHLFIPVDRTKNFNHMKLVIDAFL